MKALIKRLLALFLLLCLMCPSALAEGDPVSQLPVVQGFASLCGMLYALSYEGVYRLEGEGWRQCLTSYDVRAIAPGDEALYLLLSNPEDETFAICAAARQADGSLGEPEVICAILWGLRRSDWPEFYGFAVTGDTACVLVFDQTAAGGEWFNNSLYRVSLADGRADKLAQGLMTGLAAYRDGQMLTCDNELRQLIAIDPAAATLSGLAPLPGDGCGGPVWDAERDVVLVRHANTLYGYDGATQQPRSYGYLPPSSATLETLTATIHEGRYYITDHVEEGFVSCAADPDASLSRVLRIPEMNYATEQIRDYVQENPGAAVEYLSDVPQDAESLLRHMQSSAAADIYALSLDCGYFAAMRDKGYLADLSSSAGLMETVQRMYPQLTKDLLVDGRLYALPVYAYGAIPGYHAAALEAAGLTGADLPGSYAELLDFIALWEKDYYDDYPGLELFGGAFNLRAQLLDDLLDAQLLLCEARGEPPTFDTPAFRQLLARLDKLRPAIDQIAPAVGDGVVLALDPDSQLLTNRSPLPTVYHIDAQPLPLSLTPGDPPVIGVTMIALVVNPYSDQADAATDLLTWVAERLPRDFKAAMMPDENEPLENSFYTEHIAESREYLALLTDLLETCDPADRATLEFQLKDQQTIIAELEHARWDASAEDLALYREVIAPYLTVKTSPMLSSANEETRALRTRYLDGQIGAEQFIRELSRMASMKVLEGR